MVRRRPRRAAAAPDSSPSKDQVRYRSPATALSGALCVVVEPLAALAAQPTGLDHATE